MEVNLAEMITKVGGIGVAMFTLGWVIQFLLNRIEKITAECAKMVTEANARTDAERLRADAATKIGVDIALKLTDVMARWEKENGK